MPREPYAGPAPWSVLMVGAWATARSDFKYLQTPDDDPAFLYQDVLIALDPARGLNIGEPSLHARCLDALEVGEGEAVLHVGAGSGYYTSGVWFRLARDSQGADAVILCALVDS